MSSMPRRVSKKVEIRAGEVAHLLRVRGCIATRAVVELGFSRTQAEAALKHLAATGRAVRIKVGRVALWCYSQKSAARHIHRLRRVLHMLICATKARHISPRDALEIIMKNRNATRLFSRYIDPRAEDAAALHFLAGLLASMYGKALRIRKGRVPIYFADCRRKRLPPLRFQQRQKKEYRSVQVMVEPELREILLKAAEAEGTSVSALVRRAVERLLERVNKEKSFTLLF
jgi:uncharacterized protein YfcZ (UPF0381/DUF406 family)